MDGYRVPEEVICFTMSTHFGAGQYTQNETVPTFDKNYFKNSMDNLYQAFR